MSTVTSGHRDAPSEGPTRSANEAGAEALEEDDLFHLLQNRRRRLVLRALRGREGPVEMGAVVDQVAAWEHDTTVEELQSAQRQRVYIALYQRHLPAFDEAGVIEYDQRGGTIALTPRIECLYEVLAFEPADAAAGTADRDLVAYFGGASLTSTGLVAAAWLGLVVLPGLVVAAIVTTLFTIVTLGLGRGR